MSWVDEDDAPTVKKTKLQVFTLATSASQQQQLDDDGFPSDFTSDFPSPSRSALSKSINSPAPILTAKLIPTQALDTAFDQVFAEDDWLSDAPLSAPLDDSVAKESSPTDDEDIFEIHDDEVQLLRTRFGNNPSMYVAS